MNTKVYAGLALWPDFPGRYFNYVGSTGEDLWLFWKDIYQRYIDKKARVLDLGAGDNTFAETLRKNGYENVYGLDLDPVILNSPCGMQMNFRDLPLTEQYRVLHFFQFLDFFEGGAYDLNHYQLPLLNELVKKIKLHLEPDGYLIFIDSSENILKFIRCLQKNGFVLLDRLADCYVLQKVQVN